MLQITHATSRLNAIEWLGLGYKTAVVFLVLVNYFQIFLQQHHDAWYASCGGSYHVDGNHVIPVTNILSDSGTANQISMMALKCIIQTSLWSCHSTGHRPCGDNWWVPIHRFYQHCFLKIRSHQVDLFFLKDRATSVSTQQIMVRICEKPWIDDDSAPGAGLHAHGHQTQKLLPGQHRLSERSSGEFPEMLPQ